MSRFKILASVVPLLIAALFARESLSPGQRPCISVGESSVHIAPVPWQAQLHVGFTDDPALATVRVRIADSPEAADTRLVAISATPVANAPVIYFAQDGPADYRIFVRSKSFSARDAAALIVGASGGHRRLEAAAL